MPLQKIKARLILSYLFGANPDTSFSRTAASDEQLTLFYRALFRRGAHTCSSHDMYHANYIQPASNSSR